MSLRAHEVAQQLRKEGLAVCKPKSERAPPHLVAVLVRFRTGARWQRRSKPSNTRTHDMKILTEVGCQLYASLPAPLWTDCVYLQGRANHMVDKTRGGMGSIGRRRGLMSSNLHTSLRPWDPVTRHGTDPGLRPPSGKKYLHLSYLLDSPPSSWCQWVAVRQGGGGGWIRCSR